MTELIIFCFLFPQKPIKKSCTLTFPFRLYRCQFYNKICFISSLDESILVHTAFPLSINVFDYVFLSIYLKLGSRKLGENKVDVFKKGRELTLTNLTPPLQILLIAKVSFWQMSSHYCHLIKTWWAFLLSKVCWNFCFMI